VGEARKSRPLVRFLALSTTVGAAAVLAATASPATAARSIGFIDQNGPAPPALCINPDPQDLVEAIGPAAPSYTVPPAPGQSLVISTWSHYAAFGSAPLEFKVYRPVSGSTYRVVAHDGPRQLNPGAVNTFRGLYLPVLPGDVIGLHTVGAATACHINAPGESYLFRTGDLADGQEGAFLQNTGELLNVIAVVVPDNRFTVQEVKRKKKRGRARITLNIPNPGVLHLAGTAAILGTRDLQVSSGPVSFVVGATRRGRGTLRDRGKLRVIVQMTYVPTGGDGVFVPLKLTLRKQPR
jgi:hypothetical protein